MSCVHSGIPSGTPGSRLWEAHKRLLTARSCYESCWLHWEYVRTHGRGEQIRAGFDAAKEALQILETEMQLYMDELIRERYVGPLAPPEQHLPGDLTKPTPPQNLVLRCNQTPDYMAVGTGVARQTEGPATKHMIAARAQDGRAGEVGP